MLDRRRPITEPRVDCPLDIDWFVVGATAVRTLYPQYGTRFIARASVYYASGAANGRRKERA